MANSKLLPANNLSLNASIHQFLVPVIGARPYASTTLLLAYSGGLDSSVLLHLLLGLRSRLHFKLNVMHVHHGISPNADAWADFCTACCQRYGVECVVKHVKLSTHHGLGVEAAARQARYEQLNSVEADFILLAHHQQDQAETLLLQLARGAGIKGLSAMAMIDDKRRLLRPLLDIERNTLLQYAQAHHLRWIEDESNDDTRYTRNFIRHDVLPVLNQRYPAIFATLSRTAVHMAEASQLLDDLASLDAAQALQSSIYSGLPCLDTAYMKNLTVARAHNLLRYWLAQQTILMPSTEHLNQLRHQLLASAPDADLNIRVSEHLSVRHFQQLAYLVRHDAVAPDRTLSHKALVWRGENELVLEHGTLYFKQVLGQGLSLTKLSACTLSIAVRSGGEKLKPELGRPTRSIKYLLQTAHIPPWLRANWPLIKQQQQLLCVPNVASECQLQAAPDQLGLLILWQPRL